MRPQIASFWKLAAAFTWSTLHALPAGAQSGTIQLSSAEYSVKESAPVAKITVRRVGGSSGTVSVDFATADGIAIASEDYLPANGTLTFGPGVTSLSFNVAILNDGKNEPSETLTIELSNPGNGMSLGNATLTIADNDACAYAIALTKRTHGPDADAGTVSVTATEGCQWIATSSVDWIAIGAGASGNGNGEVSYSLDANTSARPRVGTLRIAGKTFTVTQQGVFSPVAGNYNGLFHEETVLQHDSSGFLSIRVTDLGAFSARMVLAGKRHSFSGNFAVDGIATHSILRPGTGPLSVLLSLDLHGDTDQITGQISDGTWVSLLTTDRALYNKTDNVAPQAGRYTLLILGDDDNAGQEPGGDSFGTVTVDVSGNVKLSATLADGTKATQGVALSQEGHWPLYVPLYGGQGFVLCKVIFADADESDFDGTLTWIKPALPTAKFYAAGFAKQPLLIGSRYHPPINNTDRLLNFGVGGVEFTAGNLAETFENSISLGNDNKVANSSPNKLTLTIVQPTGLFKGTVTEPGTTRGVPFKGALFQKKDYGSGFFLGSDQSGRVRLAE